MGQGARYHIPFRRRREGKTDYNARMALLKSGLPRVVVRKSLSGTTVQFIDFNEEGDRVVAQASFKDLEKLGWKHSMKDSTASYLVGLLAGTRAIKADQKEGVLDIGLQEPVPKSRVFASLKGVLDSGVDVPHGDGILPDEDRIAKGKKMEKGFEDDFESIKKKILEM